MFDQSNEFIAKSAEGGRHLSLSFSDRNWRLFMARKSDPGFVNFKRKVLMRDAYSCYFCRFQADQFMEVININRNYADSRYSNMTTACPFCAQCHFVESVGQSDLDGGVLIYLPEISQTQLNALSHALFALMACGSHQEDTIKNIYRSLRLRAQVTDKLLGEGMSQPQQLGRLMVESGLNSNEQFQKEVWRDLRMLPLFSRFVHHVETWGQSAFSSWSDH